jgi:hypothetical protein
MQKQEFEALAGYMVSLEDYYGIIEPMYMAANLSKAEFVKTLSRKRFELKVKPVEKPVFISEGYKTPNRCYYIGRWMMQVGYPKVNIGTGKTTITVREMTCEEQLETGWDSYLSSSIDIDPSVVKVIEKK